MENTLRTYEGICGRFTRQVGEEMQLSKLTAADVSAYVFDGSVKAVAQKKRHTHLRALLRWLDGEDLLTENPMGRIKPPKVDWKMPVACRADELALITRTMEARHNMLRERENVRNGEIIWKARAFEFAFYTGFRRSEIARLRWRDIDLDAGTVHMREQKNRTEQIIPIAAPALDVLYRVMPWAIREEADRPAQKWKMKEFARVSHGALEGTKDFDSPRMADLRAEFEESVEDRMFVFRAPGFTKTKRNQRSFGNNLSRTFRQYRDRAGVRKALNFHSLRAGFCTALANAEKSAAQIKAAARHADIATSLRYIEQSTANVRDT